MEKTNIQECTPRNVSEAPGFSYRSVMQWLAERGAKGIINTRCVAYIVGCSLRTVKNAERNGEIKAIDKCTYELDSVARWLMKHPRFLAQDRPSWNIDEKAMADIRNIVVSKHQTLIQMFNNDVDELVQEIACRLLKKKKGKCSFSTAVYSVIGYIKRENLHRIKTVPISTIR